MDHIKSQLDQLSELSTEQVTELQNSIVSEFDTVEQETPTPATVDAMTSLADALDTVRGEVKRREVQAEELSARALEASSRVRGEDVMDESGVPEAEDAEVAPEEEEAPVQASAAVEEEITLATEEEIEPAVELAVEEDVVAEAPAAVELSADDKEDDKEEEEEEEEKDDKSDNPFLASDEVETPVEEVAAEASSEEAPLEETVPEAEASAEVEVEAEASNTEETPIELSAQEEAPVTAAADGAFEAPADRRPVVQATVAPVAITAGADIPGYTAGSSISSMSDVSQAMEKRLHSLRRVNGGDGEQHIVASLTTQFPDSLILGSNAEENSTKLANLVGPKALAASGGFAAPLAPSYNIFGFGTDVRPVRDSLPRMQADRGGIRFVTPPVLGSYAGAVGVWTEANDIAASAGTPVKNSLTVGGATEQTEMTYAVTLQLKFGNLMTRAYPELISRHNELALIQHARISEQTLLSKIGAKSTAVTAGVVLGVARDFLVQIKRAAAAYRSRHRIDPGTQLKAIIPSWVYDAMAADLTLNMPGDQNLGASRADLDSYLALSNVTLTASIDQNTFGAQAVGVLLDFPTSFTWYLFAEGSFVFLDGGVLDIGIIRDSGLVGSNDYKMFTETFEGLAFVGIESLAVTSTIVVSGSAAALQDTQKDVLAPLPAAL